MLDDPTFEELSDDRRLDSRKKRKDNNFSSFEKFSGTTASKKQFDDFDEEEGGK